MTDLIIALVVGIISLLGVVSFQGERNKKLKAVKKEQTQEIKKKEEQINTVSKLQEEINEVKQESKEEKPQKVEEPDSGDVDTRISRLNKLHLN